MEKNIYLADNKNEQVQLNSEFKADHFNAHTSLDEKYDQEHGAWQEISMEWPE